MVIVRSKTGGIKRIILLRRKEAENIFLKSGCQIRISSFQSKTTKPIEQKCRIPSLNHGTYRCKALCVYTLTLYTYFLIHVYMCT